MWLLPYAKQPLASRKLAQQAVGWPRLRMLEPFHCTGSPVVTHKDPGCAETAQTFYLWVLELSSRGCLCHTLKLLLDVATTT